MIHTDGPTQPRIQRTRKFQVLAAMALPALLGLLLAVRMASTEGHASPAAPSGDADARTLAAPPSASVPAPKPFDPRTLKFPCWACKESQDWPVRFQTDLDLLAPLGTGTVNAAQWLKDFSKQTGSRAAEAEAAAKRYLPPSGRFTKTLPPDDPLLLEAEPWCDTAVMRFYPDIYPFAGVETRIPNLIFALGLGQSWAARGTASADTEAAMQDLRRAIRWGRLLRQEDVTLIADLVGIACIQYGAQGIYDRAVREGNINLALLASVVLSEVAPQRLMTSNRIDKIMIHDYLDKGFLGGLKLSIPDRRVESITNFAASTTDRRFLFEALMSMNLIRFKGPSEQREMVDRTFQKLLASKDPVTLAMVRWANDTELTEEVIENYFLQ